MSFLIAHAIDLNEKLELNSNRPLVRKSCGDEEQTQFEAR